MVRTSRSFDTDQAGSTPDDDGLVVAAMSMCASRATGRDNTHVEILTPARVDGCARESRTRLRVERGNHPLFFVVPWIVVRRKEDDTLARARKLRRGEKVRGARGEKYSEEDASRCANFIVGHAGKGRETNVSPRRSRRERG